jgi:RNA polymerase sigma-70 factor (ECF subfamily)
MQLAPSLQLSRGNNVEEPLVSAEDLARQAQAGCDLSFERLVGMFRARIFNYLLQMVGNEHDAEDLVQETFLKAYKSIARYDSHYRFSTWIFTIAKNSAMSFYRGRRADSPIDEVAETLPAPQAEAGVDAEWLWRAARALKPRQFEALWLRYAEGFSIEEAAHVMKINQISLKVVLHRARNALGKKLQSHNWRLPS